MVFLNLLSSQAETLAAQEEEARNSSNLFANIVVDGELISGRFACECPAAHNSWHCAFLSQNPLLAKLC